jgi:hypothetical protein
MCSLVHLFLCRIKLMYHALIWRHNQTKCRFHEAQQRKVQTRCCCFHSVLTTPLQTGSDCWADKYYPISQAVERTISMRSRGEKKSLSAAVLADDAILCEVLQGVGPGEWLFIGLVSKQ